LVARELVEDMGVSGRRAAELLGIAPSAVSQYLSGRRLRTLFPAFAARGEARRTARRVAQALADVPPGMAAPPRLLLEAAADLAERVSGPSGPPPVPEVPEGPFPDRELVRVLRKRVVGEQAAVAGCMHLAQKARDELTRAIFRQIASDSLRHAEIVASLAGHLDRGTSSTYVSGITRRDVEKLIQAENEAEREGRNLSRGLGGTMGLLAASMEADERKHDELLKGLLTAGFGDQ
jgi:rubrerythrin